MPLIPRNPKSSKQISEEKSLEERFPNWPTVRNALESLIDSICGWDIAPAPFNNRTVLIGLATNNEFPQSQIPTEYFDTVFNIFDTVLKNFVEESAKTIIGLPQTAYNINALRNLCIQSEYESLSHSGEGVKYQLALALGLPPYKYLGKPV